MSHDRRKWEGKTKKGDFFFLIMHTQVDLTKKIASDSDISVRAFDLFVVERKPKLCLPLKIACFLPAQPLKDVSVCGGLTQILLGV